MNFHNPTISTFTSAHTNQTCGGGSDFNTDEDTDDFVGTSVNFALRRASEAAVWYRQKNHENEDQPSGTTASYQQPYFYTITPSNLENPLSLQAQFSPLPSSNSEMRPQSASSSFSSSTPQSSLLGNTKSQYSQDSSQNQSPNTSEDSTEPPPRKNKRRKSENLDPSSARARYLEKNREAASRCRRNQKKKTENLVEKARNMEEKNRILKVEVACLKDDMASLMDIVASHSQCSDARLHTYVQREANRLADGRRRSFGEPLIGSTPPPGIARSLGEPFRI